MVISGRQIRAARALLDMSQESLAELAGLTPQGIRKIEDGAVQPREGTMSDLLRVFAEHRLEFLDNEGVRFRAEDVEVLNGKSGVEKFWNRVFTFAQVKGGIIRQNGIPEKPLDACNPEAAAQHRDRMTPLVHTRKDIFMRVILEEGDQHFLCDDYVDYRWNPKEFPPPVPYYIFGDSVAVFAFEADPSPKIILVTSPVIAAAYTKQFDRVWELAKLPPKDDQKRRS